MYILGINSVYHESSACLLADGVIVAAAEEERFNRMKHGKQARIDNPDELPLNAIRYCLDSAGIGLGDVAHIGYSTNPQKMAQGLEIEDEMDENVWSNAAGKAQFLSGISSIPEKISAMGFHGKWNWIDHHLAHAASAFYVSGFREAAVLSVDGIGDEISTATFFYGKNNQLHFLQEIPMPASLGFLWELNSLLLGFSVYDAAKIMGLAAYGNPERYANEFKQLVRLVSDGKFEMDNDLLRFGVLNYEPLSAYYAGLEALFGIKKRERDQKLEAVHQDIAAALQQRTDEAVYHMVEHLHDITHSDNLCLAGGVALNCVTNRVVFEEGPFANLYVQAGAHDGGTALGAAFYVWNHILENESRQVMGNAYLGPSFSNSEIETTLQKHQLKYRRSEKIEQEVAQLLSQQAIVGFFQGGMEFGPRALGNRSLLADPRNPQTREIMNHKVKHREYFRPFAPSILHEEAKKWFEIKKETSASDFMLMAYAAVDSVKDKIPAVLHVDGTSRLQTVKKEENPRYYNVIAEFYQITGVPIVLNTSFNDQEPIVCTPTDAIKTFMKTQIDYLAIGDFLVSKAENRR